MAVFIFLLKQPLKRLRTFKELKNYLKTVLLPTQYLLQAQADSVRSHIEPVEICAVV
jgi:hypothetical protein